MPKSIQMWPRTTHLLAILSFLVEMTISSPVYNMQPAYITATIGSTGRNIRNLPCISRKSNQSGVCMFAIDCLKANGTHLGTCIDRFYFGSCCHIEPLQDITENTIDAALIPSRQPPNRIASTVQVTTSSTTPFSTTSAKSSTADTPSSPKPSTITTEQTTSESSSPSSTSPQSVTTDDIESYKITTFQTVDDVPVTGITTTIKSIPIKTRPTLRPATTPTPVATTKITTKITKPKPQTTPKPKPTYVNNTTSHQTTKPVSTITRPRPRPTKPVKITKPIAQNTTATTSAPTSSVTPAPTSPKQTTTRTATTTRSTKLTKKPTIVTKGTTTRKPIITTQSKLPDTVTTMRPTTTTIKTTTKLTTIQSTTGATSTSTLSNEVLADINATITGQQKQPEVNGNPATNQIEALGGITSSKPSIVSSSSSQATSTTSGLGLVTWSEINKNSSSDFNVSSHTSITSASGSSASSSSSSTEEDVTHPEDWVPITDGWVLLPSLTTTTERNEITTVISSTETSEEVSSSNSESSSSSFSTSDTETSSVDNNRPLLTSSTEALTSITESSPTSSVSTESQSSTTEDASLLSSSATTSAPVATSGINMSDFTDVCGRRMVPEGRIVGGEKSSFGKWPWQISLRQWRTSTYLHKCGAALLNENWAITAAHCVDNVPPSDLLLRLGEHDLSTEAEPYLHQERRVQIVASHPQFDPRTFEYDLALLRFYEPVTFQPNIIPVCVPQTDENFVGRNAYVTGWGRLYEDGPLPSVLQEVSVPVINNTVCESMYRSAGYIEHIPNIFICAGWRRGGFDSCEGDSGGPMVIQRPDKRFILAGVISWGIGCAEPNQPGVYTRISEFKDWINQILQF